ncbi:MAG: restriction endonuclease subunit S [Alphaproteobacteria bacterium]|nr:restriction endonuclease subunit S [Alphaproteobacteria bacterium]
MSEWKQCCLADVTESLDSLRKPVKGSERNLGQYPYYGASGIVDYVDDYLFDGLYLLVAEDGENLKTRKTPIAFLANGKFWVNNHAHVLKENGKSNIRFLSYALQVADIHSFLTGSTIPKLTKANLDKIPIYLPNKKEQSVIAEVLGALDDKIELNRKMNATLEAMARALFKSWFVDFDPVRAKSEGREPFGMDAETAALFPSALGDIPDGWSVESVYYIADIINGAPFKSELFNQEKRGLPLIRIRDLSSYSPTFYTDEQHPKAEQINTGDIVVGMDAEFRAHYWMGETAYLNQRLFVARPKHNSKVFVRESLIPLLAKEENAQVGTTVAHLGKKDIDKFTVVFPNESILQQFAKRSNPLLEKMVTISVETRRLEHMRDYLLPKLISGEIRIPDAEKMVGGA